MNILLGFPSDAVLDGFDCIEPGCEGHISPISAEEVILHRSDLGDPIPSILCPECHRVYSGLNARPVVFEHTHKVFYVDGQQIARPLTLLERTTYVEYLLSDADSVREGSSLYQAYERRLAEVRALPHAEGCKGQKELFLCNCGQLLADQWVSNS